MSVFSEFEHVLAKLKPFKANEMVNSNACNRGHVY